MLRCAFEECMGPNFLRGHCRKLQDLICSNRVYNELRVSKLKLEEPGEETPSEVHLIRNNLAADLTKHKCVYFEFNGYICLAIVSGVHLFVIPMRSGYTYKCGCFVSRAT